MNIIKIVFFSFICFFSSLQAGAQLIPVPPANPLAGQQNVITTAVPFLGITPDARASGMGECGTASSPDAFSNFWNPSKPAFADKKTAVGVCYTPWLRSLMPDVHLLNLGGYWKPNEKTAIGSSARYFSLGKIDFTDLNGTSLGSFRPREFAMDVSFSRKLSANFSIGIAARLIHSNLFGNISFPGGRQFKPGVAGAGDISVYYTKKSGNGRNASELAWGLNISNVGSKLTYSSSANADFLPANLRLGCLYKRSIAEGHSLALLFDFSKLLVMSSAPNMNDPSLFQSITGSFADAPGGFREEINEINTSIGLEYNFRERLDVRSGMYYESDLKGGRQYATIGAGYIFKNFQFDASYLIPFAQDHPLSGTFRLSAFAFFGDL